MRERQKEGDGVHPEETRLTPEVSDIHKMTVTHRLDGILVMSHAVSPLTGTHTPSGMHKQGWEARLRNTVSRSFIKSFIQQSVLGADCAPDMLSRTNMAVDPLP